jgi:16S rRNA (cytosine967-C5)-methyltransferase
VEILVRVERDGAFAEPLLDRFLSEGVLADERDRRLLTELVYGTLRMQGYLDWLLGRFYRGGLHTLSPRVRQILRTALYQRYFMERIPDFALVNEAVSLVKASEPRRAALVNAILRNIGRRHASPPRPEGDGENLEALAASASHPAWLVQRWQSRWGFAFTEALCEAHNTAAPLCLRVNRLRRDRAAAAAELTGEGIQVREADFSPDGLYVLQGGALLRNTRCWQGGTLQIQDEASQLVARLVAPRRGEQILDLCAGVGGKATHLGEIMGNSGRVVAVDVSPSKIEALRGLSGRLGVTIIDPCVADARDDLRGRIGRAFDRVLLDVPCSGTGTLRRAPEIKWRLQPRDVERAVLRQRQLLQRAADLVRPGGRLVYTTCSLMAEENEAVVEAFLETRPGIRLVTGQDLPPALLHKDAYFRTFPHCHGTDGFFGAVMVKG